MDINVFRFISSRMSTGQAVFLWFFIFFGLIITVSLIAGYIIGCAEKLKNAEERIKELEECNYHINIQLNQNQRVSADRLKICGDMLKRITELEAELRAKQ